MEVKKPKTSNSGPISQARLQVFVLVVDWLFLCFDFSLTQKACCWQSHPGMSLLELNIPAHSTLPNDEVVVCQERTF